MQSRIHDTHRLSRHDLQQPGRSRFMRRHELAPASSVAHNESQASPIESDDSWLNDTRVAPPHSSSSAQHTLLYEDVPTMSLEALRAREQEQNAKNTDVTQPLSARLQQQRQNTHISGTGTGDASLLSQKIYKTYKVPAVAAQSQRMTTHAVEYGPIQPLMNNVHIRSITVQGPQQVYVELRTRSGINGRTRQIQETPYRFQNEQHMMQILESLLRSAGLTLTALSTRKPFGDVRLPDGSLLCMSLSTAGTLCPTFTLRKPIETAVSLQDLVHDHMLSQEMADTLRRYVLAQRNICICGPGDSGKMLLLNALCAQIPSDERIVTIEEANIERELLIQHPQVVTLLMRQEQQEGQVQQRSAAPVTMSDALAHAHRIRTQRIIVSRCHSDDVPALLSAMFDGASGVMTTMNANDAKDCLSRLELLYLIHHLREGRAVQVTPTLTALVRAQITAALHVIVSLSPGQKVSHIEAHI